MNLYAKTHKPKTWAKIIQEEYNDLEFDNRETTIAEILGITSKAEIKKIREGSLIALGLTLGVVTFEDACKKVGVSDSLPTFNNLDDNFTKRFIAEYKLTIIVRALNEGWYPNWSDSNEYKYFPYFNMGNAECGFSYWITNSYITDTNVPSALLLNSSKLATYCGMMFTNLYEDYLK